MNHYGVHENGFLFSKKVYRQPNRINLLSTKPLAVMKLQSSFLIYLIASYVRFLFQKAKILESWSFKFLIIHTNFINFDPIVLNYLQKQNFQVWAAGYGSKKKPKCLNS